ncbi:MAG: hypothetical protein NTU85_01560 [Candidatus Kaiserbacteria bacterium]|nr:hypothetical protein [Candidatus Kaiserbacteria bacterium]
MKRLTFPQSGLTLDEYKILEKLSTPILIQNFLDSIPINYETKGDTHMSPRRVLRENKSHCIEGALFAAAALWIHGEPPIIMNLSGRFGGDDVDHVITLYKRNGRIGAISKTNHATIRFRDPAYRTPRELALSYFHEWFSNATGVKSLQYYSKPLDMRRFGTDWITTEKDLYNIADALDEQARYQLIPEKNWRFVRKADAMELKAGSFLEWPKSP